MNSVFIIGNLTRDPEPNGVAMKFSIAHNKKWKDKTGAEQEKTNYIRCVAFGKTGEIASQFAKGMRVCVEGELSYSQWEKDGQKRDSIEVIANRVYSFGSRSEEGSGSTSAPVSAPVGDSDIPF